MAGQEKSRLARLAAQAVKFGAVGALNTLIDWGVFALLATLPFFAAHTAITKAISYTCGLANSLGLNKRFTFGDKAPMTARRLLLFLAVNLAAWGVSAAFIALLAPTGLSATVRNMVATVPSLAVNFLGNKLLVFRE